MAITYDDDEHAPAAPSVGPKIVYEERRQPDARERRAQLIKSGTDKPFGSGISDFAHNLGGSITDLLAKTGLKPEIAAIPGYVANVATQAVPALFAGGAVAKVGAPMLENAASSLMQTALKPGAKAQKLGQADPAIKTLLDEGINVTRGGAEKLQGKVTELENAISATLAQSGATVDKGQVASRIQDVVARIERTHSTPQEAIKNVQKVYDEFLTNGLIPKDIPVQRAMELKRGIYQMLRDKYGTLGSETVEAQKALGRGYKETMAAAVPEIAAPLTKQSELINALKLLERRSMQQGNNNPLSLGVSLGAAANNPAAALGLWANSSALAKSLAARGLYSGSEVIPFAAGSGGALATLLANMRQ